MTTFTYEHKGSGKLLELKQEIVLQILEFVFSDCVEHGASGQMGSGIDAQNGFAVSTFERRHARKFSSGSGMGAAASVSKLSRPESGHSNAKPAAVFFAKSAVLPTQSAVELSRKPEWIPKEKVFQ